MSSLYDITVATHILLISIIIMHQSTVSVPLAAINLLNSLVFFALYFCLIESVRVYILRKGNEIVMTGSVS